VGITARPGVGSIGLGAPGVGVAPGAGIGAPGLGVAPFNYGLPGYADGHPGIAPQIRPNPNPTRTDAAVRAMSAQAQQQRAQQAVATRANLTAQYGNIANQVFTPAWYAANPNAFQYQYPHADAFAAASFARAATWVGVAAAPVGYGYTDGTVIYEDAAASSTAQTPSTQEQAQAAHCLATSAEQYEGDKAEWLPLGVFALVRGSEQHANNLVQLNISKEGVVGGTYLDLIAHNGSPLLGALDNKSQHVAWHIGNNDDVVWETALSNLTAETAPVTQRYGTNETQQWQLVRFKQ
jgi:hypothetical protein